MTNLWIFLVQIFILFYPCTSQNAQLRQQLVNLDDRCFRCLCHAATGCNLEFDCLDGYCGPFKISRIYWKDAGQVTLPEDDKMRKGGAYEDCAFSYNCAKRIMTNYFIKYGRDCNSDGVTDCFDYSMINFNGGFHCGLNLQRNEPGRAWLERFNNCILNPEF